ncbi:ATP-dependent DNA helicase [Sutcliffiella rhizosphaerae]|uniref:ATP-dependent DNA helicase YoaA n=1 Tax=Sutcliffiella rhizosphaerae TaxID=2880967 RepID=A0ABM8YRI7_9BACI|nr:ATP-dependent DNA helicase [Sutcliffiella rhizosphaerae]CAG9622594.1 putative ATP-dependent DNA helicase YoaA [Sutcliffiella rhizosphaerae]
MNNRLPFSMNKGDSFFDRLNDWIGDVFYDILPDAGFELRDEQIFMAFQLERAFKEKKVIFSEAGVGTGKTMVYLLYAICYARYMGKPAIITCADESLIEQLVKKEGDIAKLSKVLDITMDVRLAKSPDQYLCLNKLDIALDKYDSTKMDEVYHTLPNFVNKPSAMQSFFAYGDRKDYSQLDDEEWSAIAWDSFQDCFSCEKRHRCGQTLSRDHYRKSTDLIICSHDFYMEHVWTFDKRKREGQLPLLPEASTVIFDEGHLLEFAAQKALTYKIKNKQVEEILTRLLGNDLREEFALLVEDSLQSNDFFFETLEQKLKNIPGSERKEITMDAPLIQSIKNLLANLEEIGNQLVFEGELHTVDHYQLHIVEEYLDSIEYLLKLLLSKEDMIAWAEQNKDDLTLVVMPRTVEEVLKDKVFTKKIPFIFSSATLSENENFTFLASSLGIEEYLSFSIQSPFDYENNMKLSVKSEDDFSIKFEDTIESIKRHEGRTLVLFNSKQELQTFKQMNKGNKDFPFLYEGDKEISVLVSDFQNKEESVLCAYHLWEGLDIPGPSLSNVVIWSLPFPPNDPVFAAKRKGLENPYMELDVPYMLLRLRQGIGRLIRTTEDKGEIFLYLPEDTIAEVEDKVKSILPTAPAVI